MSLYQEFLTEARLRTGDRVYIISIPRPTGNGRNTVKCHIYRKLNRISHYHCHVVYVIVTIVRDISGEKQIYSYEEPSKNLYDIFRATELAARVWVKNTQ